MTPAEHAALLAELHPPRLPQAFAELGWADMLAAFGLGLGLAALLLTLAAPLLRRRQRRPSRRRALQDRIAAAAALPGPERALALARLLAEQGGVLPAPLAAGLYRPDGADPAVLEALIRQTRAGRR